ncbi:MAG: phosphoadenylyl-sulfate reductase [Acidimicrobiales bacterium]|nr:phosphoadenylyl-sulfate reductase [Hyphomonadaceae bacterium]RZV38507.1 MAG: phosphoadenylyl-sulfate reductase [Acidimicrobiales bacterium]
MTLLKHGFEHNATRLDAPDVDALFESNLETNVRLSPDIDLELIKPRLSGLKTIVVAFPAYADGRGFSIGRQLRKRYGYKGELIAEGALIPDQYVYAIQCGFDAVKVDPDTYAKQEPLEWRQALAAFDLTYQRGYAIPNGPAQNVFDARRAKRATNRIDQYKGLSAQAALTKALTVDFKNEIVLSSSMGVDSAVLLHMISEIDPNTPILFLETKKHFKETLQYRDTLIDTLGLKNVQSLTPNENDIASEDAADILYKTDKDACCDLRKTRPLEQVVERFAARITGRKRYQTPNRQNMEILEEGDTQFTLNPLAFWTAKDVTAYMRQHQLPSHPLLKLGYLSIGCAPCTTKVEEGEDPRAGRWRDTDKDECGIHFIDGKWVRVAQQPTLHGEYI